jgi:hypothetical protein
VRITHFQFEDKFYQQKDGMAMGSSLTPAVSSILLEYFEKLSLDKTDFKPTIWLRSVDNTFHGLTTWVSRNTGLSLSSQQSQTHYTVHSGSGERHLPFLDVLVTKRSLNLSTEVYQKPAHTGQVLHFKSGHPKHVKRRVVHGLVNKAKVICQELKDLKKGIETIKQDLTFNGYLQHFINSIIISERNNCPSDRVPYGSVVIPYVRGIYEKLRSIGNGINIRIIFKSTHTLIHTHTHTHTHTLRDLDNN